MLGIGKHKQEVVHGGGIVLVPATALVEFLELNNDDGLNVRYFECLYQFRPGTRPSMELSATSSEFSSWADFIAFATDAAGKALAVAAKENSTATFEVHFDERLVRKEIVA